MTVFNFPWIRYYPFKSIYVLLSFAFLSARSFLYLNQGMYLPKGMVMTMVMVMCGCKTEFIIKESSKSNANSQHLACKNIILRLENNLETQAGLLQAEA